MNSLEQENTFLKKKMIREFYEVKLKEYYEEITNKQKRIDKSIEYCELNKEFTPRLIDVVDILKGEDK